LIFQGKWEARKIPNPDYFEESHPYKLTPIVSLALELWSMVDGIVFDNVLITSDQSIAKQYGDQIWYPKTVLEGKAISAASDSVIDAIVRATKDRPWLWAVYLVAILLPIVILFVFCWSKKPTKKKAVDGLKKKTDESEPDTNEQQPLLTRNDDDDDEEETEEIEIDEQPVKPNVTNVTGKDALENEDEEEVEVRNLIYFIV
jgi:calnexin